MSVDPATVTAGTDAVGQGLPRVDGPDKVCGLARYSGDVVLPGMVHASLLLSSIARGRIRRIDTTEAEAAPGVLRVLTPANAPRLAVLPEPVGRTLSLLQDERVHYDRQPIAMVVAQTPQAARDAVSRLRVEYDSEPPALDFERAKAQAHAPEQAQGQPADTRRGDVEAGWRAAVHRVEGTWTTPTEYHNPIEPHATVAAWDGDQLTLYDATQSVHGVRRLVAQRLGIAPEHVRVVCPHVGGAFGGKGSVWSHVLLAAMAAREVGRPVRLALERPQMFGPVGNRPRTEQRLRLGADAEGRLLAIEHAVHAETARIEDWLESSAIVTRMLYACDHVATSHRLVPLDIPVPTFQRAPGEATGTYALECAMDELAQACGLDPVELRVRNHATRDGNTGKPFSSKSLLDCYRAGADAFGWSRRDPRAGSMSEGPWRIGWGMATATYPCHRMMAEACAHWQPDGSVRVECGTQDLGTGTRTVLTQVAADALGLPPHRVQLVLGDSALPQAPISGGSMTVASTAPAVQAACAALRDRLLALALVDPASPLHGCPRDQVRVVDGHVTLPDHASRSEPVTALLARHPQPLEARGRAEPDEQVERYSRHAFGAVFVEVRVDRELGTIRVPRIVGAYGVGRLLNAQTGRSQLMGGIVWGVSMALFEHALRDPRYGRIANGNLAEYHVPVNADIGSMEVIVVPEHDPHVNPLGAKGIGEIGITGVAAAVANAVWHATGRRVRELPITLDRLL